MRVKAHDIALAPRGRHAEEAEVGVGVLCFDVYILEGGKVVFKHRSRPCRDTRAKVAGLPIPVRLAMAAASCAVSIARRFAAADSTGDADADSAERVAW